MKIHRGAPSRLPVALHKRQRPGYNTPPNRNATRSARQELLRYGHEHHRPRSKETSTLLLELFKAYSEDTDMSEKLQEFVRESIDKLLESLPAEELRKRLSVEERVKGLSADEVVRALPPEVLEALARRFKANGPSSTLQ